MVVMWHFNPLAVYHLLHIVHSSVFGICWVGLMFFSGYELFFCIAFFFFDIAIGLRCVCLIFSSSIWCSIVMVSVFLGFVYLFEYPFLIVVRHFCRQLLRYFSVFAGFGANLLAFLVVMELVFFVSKRFVIGWSLFLIIF